MIGFFYAQRLNLPIFSLLLCNNHNVRRFDLTFLKSVPFDLTFRYNATGFFVPVVRFVFGPLHKKEEQEDSVLAQRYRSWLLRKPTVYGVLGNIQK